MTLPQPQPELYTLNVYLFRNLNQSDLTQSYLFRQLLLQLWHKVCTKLF